MKRKENKPTNKIPVPVVGMSSLHPSKFKLSTEGTSVKNRKEGYSSSINPESIKLPYYPSWFRKRKRYIELPIVNNKDIMDLKKLYFKGWLLSR